jgi:hypothetical protein
VSTPKAQTKNVTLFGGPLDGLQVAVPRAAETYTVGSVKTHVFWTYEYAGKVDRKEMFAIRPSTRPARRFIAWYVGKFGRDPRIETQQAKTRPTVNTGRVAHGRGAAKRAAKRAA